MKFTTPTKSAESSDLSHHEPSASAEPCSPQNYLVLGAGKFLKNGKVNRYYRYRLEALFAAYTAGKVRQVVLSGGPREVTDMRADLLAMGVSEEVLLGDSLGLRTYDSLRRYAELWGGEPVVLVTQRFHMPRSLCLAKRVGLQATAWYAKGVSGFAGLKVRLREALAWVKMLGDLIRPVGVPCVPCEFAAPSPLRDMPADSRTKRLGDTRCSRGVATSQTAPQVAATKRPLRIYMKKRIAMLGAPYQQRSSATLVGRLMETKEFEQADTLLLYYPMQGEVDLRSLMVECWKLGKKVALPRIEGDSMQFLRVDGFDDLVPHPYGYLEPKAGSPLVELHAVSALLIVPGLAYDPTSGVRLGRGKGYYDRFLAEYLALADATPATHKPAVYGASTVANTPQLTVRILLFQAQVLRGLPKDPWDIPIPAALSENMRFGAWWS